MKVGCVELSTGAALDAANIFYKGGYIGTIWGDDTDTQILTLNPNRVVVKRSKDRDVINVYGRDRGGKR